MMSDLEGHPAWTPYWGRWRRYLLDNTEHNAEEVNTMKRLTYMAQTHRTHYIVFTAIERMRREE